MEPAAQPQPDEPLAWAGPADRDASRLIGDRGPYSRAPSAAERGPVPLRVEPRYSNALNQARREHLAESTGLSPDSAVLPPDRVPAAARELRQARKFLLSGDFAAASYILKNAAAAARASADPAAAETIGDQRRAIHAAAARQAGIPPALRVFWREERGRTITEFAVDYRGREYEIDLEDGIVRVLAPRGAPSGILRAPAGASATRTARMLAGMATGEHDPGDTSHAGWAEEARWHAELIESWPQRHDSFSCRVPSDAVRALRLAAGRIGARDIAAGAGLLQEAGNLLAGWEWGGPREPYGPQGAADRARHLRERILRSPGVPPGPRGTDQSLADDIEETAWRIAYTNGNDVAVRLLLDAAQWPGPHGVRELLTEAAAREGWVRLSGGQLAGPVIARLLDRLDRSHPPEDPGGPAISAGAAGNPCLSGAAPFVCFRARDQHGRWDSWYTVRSEAAADEIAGWHEGHGHQVFMDEHPDRAAMSPEAGEYRDYAVTYGWHAVYSRSLVSDTEYVSADHPGTHMRLRHQWSAGRHVPEDPSRRKPSADMDLIIALPRHLPPLPAPGESLPGAGPAGTQAPARPAVPPGRNRAAPQPPGTRRCPGSGRGR